MERNEHVGSDMEMPLLLFDQLLTGVVFADPGLRAIRHNAAFTRITGCAPETIPGAFITELLGEFEWDGLHETLRRGLDGQAGSDRMTISGREFAVYIFPWRKGVAVALQPALARFASEDEQFRDFILRVITDSAPILLGYVDRERRYVYGNHYYAEWFQQPLESIIGRHMVDLLGERAYSTVLPYLDMAFAGRRVSFSAELEYKAGYRNIAYTLVPHIDDTGQVIGLVIVVTDVTERRRFEQRIEESEQRYRSLFDHNPDAVFSFDLQGRFLSANGACETLSGYAPAELIGTEYGLLVLPELLEEANARFLSASRGEPQTFETTIVHKLGSLVDLSVTLVPAVVSGETVGVYGIAKDVTEQKRAQAALAQAAERERAFFRDVLAGVTSGKLRFCNSAADLPPFLPQRVVDVDLDSTFNIRTLRRAADAACKELEFSDARCQQLVTGVSEAAMNAIRHSGGGVGRVAASADGNTIQVCVIDQGQGIPIEDLPRAALERGYSTSGTLGHGFWLMLNSIDRVWLLTGPGGTTVVIEQDRTAPQPQWL